MSATAMWNSSGGQQQQQRPQQRSVSYAGFVPPSMSQATVADPPPQPTNNAANPSTGLAQLMMSLFTVEQLDLIRRLRATGITAEGVLHAFNSLEQLERDLKAIKREAIDPDASTSFAGTSAAALGAQTEPAGMQLPLVQHRAATFSLSSGQNTSECRSSSAEQRDSLAASTSRLTGGLPVPLTNAESLGSLSSRLDSNNLNVQLARAAASWRAAQVQAAMAGAQQQQQHQPGSLANEPLAHHLARLNKNALAEAALLDSLQRQQGGVCVTVPCSVRPPVPLQQAQSGLQPQSQQPLRRQSFSALTSSHYAAHKNRSQHELLQHREQTLQMSAVNTAMNGGPSSKPDHPIPNGYVPDSLRCQGGGRISNHPAVRQQPKPDIQEFVTLQDPTELEQLLKNGEEAAISEMKQFIQQYQLRQTTVGSMTNISQPYVSKFLNGNYKDLSLRCRTKIFVWYLNCRRYPEKMARFIADPYHVANRPCDPVNDPSMRARAQSLSEAANLSKQLRPIMQRVLERYYQENPTPDLQKRVQIANECNRLVCEERRSAGSPALVARELITHAVVAVWFMNRRKQALGNANVPYSLAQDDPVPRKHSATTDMSMLRLTSTGALSRTVDSGLSSCRSPYTDESCSLSVTLASSSDSLSHQQSLIATSVGQCSTESTSELSDAMGTGSGSFSSTAGSAGSSSIDNLQMLRNRRAYSESLPRRYGNLTLSDGSRPPPPLGLAVGSKRRSPCDSGDGQQQQQQQQQQEPESQDKERQQPEGQQPEGQQQEEQMSEDDADEEDDATPPARLSDMTVLHAIKMETDDS